MIRIIDEAKDKKDFQQMKNMILILFTYKCKTSNVKKKKCTDV